MNIERALEIGVVLCAVLVGSLLLRREFSSAPLPEDQAQDLSSAVLSPVTEHQVVFVYVGDINCSVCTSREFKVTLDRVVSALREEVEVARGLSFHSVGVMISSAEAKASFDYLSETGLWSEISIGGGWTNEFVRKYVWMRGGTPITPQVFVYTRDVTHSESRVMFSNESRIKGILGASTLTFILENQQWSRLLP